ncbi:MAG: hypothetical protein JSV40_05340 [Deltaproteobacteria bacterium]|nr:MAG: hypothetical protein JSV40_05340 [Deltaproteobacteria bacterium]
MKHFIGLSTALTPDFSGDYIPSLLFSAKRVPTLIDLRHVHLKTAKYQFYQNINYVLKNTPRSLIRLDRLLSAEFVTSRQKFDTRETVGHVIGSALRLPVLEICYHSSPMQSSYRNQWGLSGVTGGRAPSFRDLSVGETAALSLSKGMRRGQDSPADKLQKRPAREPWNRRKAPLIPVTELEKSKMIRGL